MKYLLDTHAALWLFEGNDKLSQTAQLIIFDTENEIFVSIVSAWEVAIKVSRGKLDCIGGSEAFLSAAKINNIIKMDIENDYLKIVEQLPFIHHDPFDRLIISNALSENMTIITIDENIQKYDVSWIW